MKLCRYGKPGYEKPGMIDPDGKLRDLSKIVDSLGPNEISPRGLKMLTRLKPESLPLVNGSPRFGVPYVGIGKFVAIGLNYSDHAKEAGLPIPAEPIVFMKATTCISGPNDDVVQPKNSTTQWDKGKGFDTAGPIGPWLVTTDEITDPQRLDMSLDVNGKRMQTGNTRTMIFSCAKIISHVSQYMTLLPGDIICTGTPPGVGLGIKPNPVFLKPGDVMRLTIEGLGEQKQRVVAYSA